MRLAYVTDIHGHRRALEQFLAAASQQHIDAIIIGGDLTPKEVAIALPFQPEETRGDEEPVVTGGEVFFERPIQSSTVTGTFTDVLLDIGRQSNGAGMATADELERTGIIVYREPNRFYELGSMLLEQQVLDRLGNFFSTDVVRPDHEPVFTAEELMIIRDCVTDWFAAYETTWTESRRLDFLKKADLSHVPNLEQWSRFAPSQFLYRCVVGNQSLGLIKPIFDALDAGLTRFEDPLGDFVSRQLVDLNDQLLQAITYRQLIHPADIEQLGRYSTFAQLLEKVRIPGFIPAAQTAFVAEYFLPSIHAWRKANGQVPVYVLLGNDDDPACIAMLQAAESRGELFALHNQVQRLPNGRAIIGSGFVDHLPKWVSQTSWLKDPAELRADLERLQAAAGPGDHLWVLHPPPRGCLDECANGHVGSTAVREFLQARQPSLALFGHIHEGPRLAGTTSLSLGRTLCVNPGGEHRPDVQAVIIDTDTHDVHPLIGGAAWI